MIHAGVHALGDTYAFPEEALEGTGLVETVTDDGAAMRVPLDPERDRPWRDDVLIWLRTSTTDGDEAAKIAECAAATLAGVTGVDQIDWRIDVVRDEPVPVSMWAWSDGDALEAFARILGLASDGWEHEADEDMFVTSKWTRRDDGEFLAPGVEEADVSYRRWTNPRRRSRSDIHPSDAETDTGP
jgi:hypothetical protein